MKHSYLILLLSLAVLLQSGCSRKTEPDASESDNAVADAPWMTDFETAKQKAAAESKDLLVNFSGSDWCYWCKRLDGEVFSKQGFIEQADKVFVLVLIDFPSDKSRQPKTLQAQNDRLAKQFNIRGYPTVILMRADGMPYAETGYQEGGPDVYWAHLQELRQKK